MKRLEKLLILGASGLVGKALMNKCESEFDVYGTYYTSDIHLGSNKKFQLNIQDHKALVKILNCVEPDLIISSLHGDYEQLFEFHQILAEELKTRNSLLYFLSTTNVFDGDLSRHHSELDQTTSKSEYGQYKINCERMLQDLLKNRAIIIRIPGIWGKNSPRFNTLQMNIKTKGPIQAYRNLECSFLSDIHLANQLHFIFKNEVNGIIHLGSEYKVIESQFYDQLLQQLTSTDFEIHYTDYQEKESLYYFGLDSVRNELPEKLKMQREDILTYLIK